MVPIDQDEFQRWMTLLRGDIQGVHDRLDELNGRTRSNEQDIAVLKDRGTRDPMARWTAVFVGAGGVLAEIGHRVLGTK